MVGLILEGFQLVHWWVIPALIIVGAAIIAGFLFYQSAARKRTRDNKTVLVANSARQRSSSAYQTAVKNLWVQIIALTVVAGITGVVAVAGASRPVAVDIENPERYNRDIVLCLDASSSMFDINVQILEKFTELADGFQGERIALTIFNATSLQVFPLTDDYDYIQQNLQRMANVFTTSYDDPETAAYLAATLGREEGASLVGDGLYGCSLSFDYQEDENRSRSIILASDNVVNGVELVPLDEAAQLSAEKNIRVYGINPGDRGLGVLFVPEAAINSMQAAVESTGGKFFMLTNTAAASTIIDEISNTESTIIQGSPMVIRKDMPELILTVLALLTVISTGFAIWRKV